MPTTADRRRCVRRVREPGVDQHLVLEVAVERIRAAVAGACRWRVPSRPSRRPASADRSRAARARQIAAKLRLLRAAQGRDEAQATVRRVTEELASWPTAPAPPPRSCWSAPATEQCAVPTAQPVRDRPMGGQTRPRASARPAVSRNHRPDRAARRHPPNRRADPPTAVRHHPGRRDPAGQPARRRSPPDRPRTSTSR